VSNPDAPEWSGRPWAAGHAMTDYTIEPEMTEGEKAALHRASRQMVARMRADERARWEAAIADPWATS
jgi:hypothetical protein